MFDRNLQDQARHMANLCNLSQQQPLTVRRNAKRMGYTAIKQFVAKNAHAYGYVCDDHLVISFVSSLVHRDHRTHAKNIAGYPVNRTYQQIVDRMWTEMSNWIQLYPGRKKYFCGHGTGGAIAVLAASRMKKFTTVITFSSAKPGCLRFRNWVTKHHLFYRLNTYHDSAKIVPWFHSHVGYEYTIDRNGEIRRTSWTDKISQIVKLSGKNFVGIKEYSQLLNKKAKN